MRALAARVPELSPEIILQMATINTARALGREHQVGDLVAGALADLIALPWQGRKTDAGETVLHHQGDVAASMIGGRWALPPRGT